MARNWILAGIAVLIGVSTASFNAQAEDDDVRMPWEPECARGYRYESYGLGLGEGFLSHDERKEESPYFRRRCYLLGYDDGAGASARHERSPKFCNGAFDRSTSDGLEGEIQVVRSPSDCSNAGYFYGRALLGRYARAGAEDQVGKKCVSEYDRGFNDAARTLASAPKTDNKLAYCYGTGYWDGSASHGVPTRSKPLTE